LALLVLDEQFSNQRLVLALRDRGIDAATISDFGVAGQSDPDVGRAPDSRAGARRPSHVYAEAALPPQAKPDITASTNSLNCA
jgi:hypothetical protein